MTNQNTILEKLVASPCCHPEWELEQALCQYSALGFKKFEAFTSWAHSALDVNQPPATYQDLACKYQMEYYSMHLPLISDELESSLAQAVQAARMARALGCKVVLYKGTSRANYIVGARRFLDAIEGWGLTPVLQNHAGSPITTLDDFREVLTGINDPRMNTLLEVGHFHSAGVSWQQGYELLAPTMALVHIKDQTGTQSVPFGTGEIDLPGLFKHLQQFGYTGNLVVEMEVADTQNTLQYLAEALEYIQQHW